MTPRRPLEIEAPFDDRLLKLEGWDAVDQQAAGAALRFKNGDRVAELREFIRAGLPPGPPPTTATRLPFGGAMAASPRAEANAYSLMNFSIAPIQIGSDGPFTVQAPSQRRSCGQTAAADFRHIAGRTGYFRRVEEMSLGGEAEPFGNPIAERASRHAG